MKKLRQIMFVVGPSHIIRWQWHQRDGVVPSSLPVENFIGIGGAPVWSHSLFEQTVSAVGQDKNFALLVPDFRFGNCITLEGGVITEPLLQDGFLGINPAALMEKHDQLMLKRSLNALRYWHKRFGERVCYIFWCLFGRQVHDRISGKYVSEGRYRHPVFNYDEITNALPELDIVDLSPLLRRPMHDVRRLFIDTSSHPSQVGYLMLNEILFNGLDTSAFYEHAVLTVETDLVALAQKIRVKVGKPLLLTGRSIWLDVLMQTLGATGAAKLAKAGLVLVPVDRSAGQAVAGETLRQYPLGSCFPFVVSAGGSDLSALLDPIFGTPPGFWRSQPVLDWEGATETAILSRGETPRFNRVASHLPKAPNTIHLDLPSHAVEQGPLGIPSWSGIKVVLQSLPEKLNKLQS